jgi:hypothetical protein
VITLTLIAGMAVSGTLVGTVVLALASDLFGWLE